MMNMIDIIDLAMLDTLSSEAGQSPRLRKNHNFHRCPEAACNRLLNGIEPDSYIRPHRHLDEEKDESVVILRGRLGVIAFDDIGSIMQKTLLVPGGEAVAVNVPCGVFHTFVSLEKGTVFFETKAGPYKPISEEESAQWAPAEGSTDANTYLEKLKKLWGK
jgi:cupin fold WbuC family metalloprotein